MLNETKIKSLKPKDKPYKIGDSEGLYLLISPNGSKLWRFKYRFNNKEKTYSIGKYPVIKLAEAREERLNLKKLITKNIDPNDIKKKKKQEVKAKEENLFKHIALEWYSKNSAKWSPNHAKKILGWLDADIIPVIGDIVISEIKPPDILMVLNKIESRGALDVARRCLSICSQIFRYGIPLGKCDYDFTIGLSATLEVRKRKNLKCIPIEDFPQLLRKLEKHNCSILTKYALKLVILTFVRSGELRGAKWEEINFDKREWRIPEERMKMNEVHIVPLANQAIEILDNIKLLNLDSEYIFPNINNTRKIMSENTMLYALYDMGYHNKMTVHGFRQLASTILNEQGYNRDAIERQLAHAERNNVRKAYNHAQYLQDRRLMMQDWADYIDELRGKG